MGAAALIEAAGTGQTDASESRLTSRPRLTPFVGWQNTSVIKDMGPISQARWPQIEGSLIVLFTARSGSTFLTRELETVFDIGKMSESLNPRKVSKQPPQKKIPKVKGAWFAAKAGVQGVVSAELCGFFDTYLSQTCFIRLLRKDIVAQAVSTAKVSQTRAWHSNNAPVREAEYDRKLIAQSVVKIDRAVTQLREYAKLTGRPCKPLIYEDISDGDVSAALKVADSLGVPRRASLSGVVARPVERVGDAVNDAWIARFNEEIDGRARDCIASYVAAIEAEI